MEQEEAHGRGLEREYRPFLDRADGQGQEDEDRAEAPEDDLIDHAIPAPSLYPFSTGQDQNKIGPGPILSAKRSYEFLGAKSAL
jgi:hypothetical protein